MDVFVRWIPWTIEWWSSGLDIDLVQARTGQSSGMRRIRCPILVAFQPTGLHAVPLRFVGPSDHCQRFGCREETPRDEGLDPGLNRFRYQPGGFEMDQVHLGVVQNWTDRRDW